MANSFIGADSAPANYRIVTGQENYRPILDAFCLAKARFEANCHEDEEDQSLLGTYCDALNCFMLSPAATIDHLAEKLRIFKAEELKSWYIVDAIIASMAADAKRLAEAN